MSAPKDFSEIELLTRLKEGCTLSFEKIYNHYKYKLTINILSLIKDEEITQDIVQELFIKIWNCRSSIDIDRSFKSYLYKIAKSLVIDTFRRSARDKNLEDRLLKTCAIRYTHIEEEIEQKEDLAILQEIINTLPPQRKLIYTLCKIEGKSYKEVGEALGISIHTVNDHIKKANSSIKNYLKQSDQLLAGLVCCTILMNL